MKKTLKKYFIPHAENNYHPHILHTKRAIFYVVLFIILKAIVIIFVLFLPSAVFVLPDILAEQQSKIIALTNDLRLEKGLPQLAVSDTLNFSSDIKAVDMAEKGYFSHTSPEGRKLAYYLRQVGYKYNVAGENLALGFSSAEDVVNAWIKSPTHYANLIDEDYKEMGVSLESGLYEGQPTVYAVEHFGTPVSKEDLGYTATAFEPVKTFPKAEEKIIIKDNTKVAGIGISNELALAETADKSLVLSVEPVRTIYNREESKIYWEEKNNATTFNVEANIVGPVRNATVNINGYPIELNTDSNNSYFGSLTVQEPSENFFKIIISPTITITGDNGEVIKDSIEWDRVKIVSQTPIQKYIYAREWMGTMFPIFSISRWIYIFFLIFFCIALAINILVEIRKQHHHIILQTLLLIGLISYLIIV